MAPQDFTVPPELIRAYVVKLNTRLVQLRQLQLAEDRDAIIALCHQLAGSAGLYGLTDLGELARAAELAISSGDALEVALAALRQRMEEALS
jgi:HPt (histidine-containing phosphotransfer) domain-containing protein